MRCLQKFDDPSHAAAVQPLVGDPEIGLRTVAREILAHWNIVASAELVLSRDSVSPLDRLLIATAKQEGDDLILACERHPMMKRLGKTLPLTKSPLTSAQVKSLLLPKLSASQMKELEQLRDVDFSYEVKSDSLRFRANVFQDASGIAAVFRIIKGTVPDIEKLGLPPVVIKLGELKNGLVLVGGPTGSGKSTTLAALVNYINRKYGRHIISLEDPIEVLHPSIKSLVTQREVGTHTQSFGNALRATLREDPNVILVGELRDLATISFAVTAAETGHLVFGTVHTVSADTTVDRMINAFPARQQETVRSMLAESLRAPPPAQGRSFAVSGDGDDDQQRRHLRPHPQGKGVPDSLGGGDRARGGDAADGYGPDAPVQGGEGSDRRGLRQGAQQARVRSLHARRGSVGSARSGRWCGGGPEARIRWCLESLVERTGVMIRMASAGF